MKLSFISGIASIALAFPAFSSDSFSDSMTSPGNISQSQLFSPTMPEMAKYQAPTDLSDALNNAADSIVVLQALMNADGDENSIDESLSIAIKACYVAQRLSEKHTFATNEDTEKQKECETFQAYMKSCIQILDQTITKTQDYLQKRISF